MDLHPVLRQGVRGISLFPESEVVLRAFLQQAGGDHVEAVMFMWSFEGAVHAEGVQCCSSEEGWDLGEFEQ